MKKLSALEISRFVEQNKLSAKSLPTVFGITPKQVRDSLENGTDNEKVIKIIHWLNVEREREGDSCLLALKEKLDFSYSELAAFLSFSVSKVQRILSGESELSFLEAKMISILLENNYELNQMLER